ncbi:MAG: hypothetical protein ACU836_15875 [Gammaproteobacteria bacterium]
MSKLSSFTYGEIALTETVLIDGIPHITRKGIGEWLEYADQQKAIDNILDRNPHFLPYSVPLNLRATDGKNYETNVYHPIGFLLIVMESGQPKAKEKKVEVAEFVWRFSNPGTEKLSPRDKRGIASRITALVGKLPKISDALVLKETWLEITSLCDKLGRPYPDHSLLGKSRQQISLENMDVSLLLPNQPSV